MQVLKTSTSNNYLVSICIGDKYYKEWQKYASPFWLDYVNRHNLGLIVFDSDLIEKESKYWKKPTWQKMLIGSQLKKSNINVKNILYLDSDILISPLAPNVFNTYDPNSIAVVSQVRNLPQPLHLTLRRLAFLRHTHLSSRYPLDSALFMSPADIFAYHSLPSFDNYFCAGMFIFNIDNHSQLMSKWFEKYFSDIMTITGGGDEAHMNYEIQSYSHVQWLPYEFQALWTYECAFHYPFLYSHGLSDTTLIRSCIRASLYSNHFLHFAGSWNESQMWKNENIFSADDLAEARHFSDYLNTSVSGRPIGMTKPS